MMWVAAVATFGAVFLATLAILWPKRVEPIAAWEIPDDEAFDEALTSGGPLPWIWHQ